MNQQHPKPQSKRRRLGKRLNQIEQDVVLQKELATELAEVKKAITEQEAVLSKAATNLKWRQHDLKKLHPWGMQSVIKRVQGEQKGWQKQIQGAHEAAVVDYDDCRLEMKALKKQRGKLETALADVNGRLSSQPEVKIEQAKFVMNQGGETGEDVAGLMAEVKRVSLQIEQLDIILQQGEAAKTAVVDYIQKLKNPPTSKYNLAYFIPDFFLVLFTSFHSFTTGLEDNMPPPPDTLVRALADFEAGVAEVGYKFWPSLQIEPYELNVYQKNQRRIEEKLTQLQRVRDGLVRKQSEFQQEQDATVTRAWGPNN